MIGIFVNNVTDFAHQIAKLLPQYMVNPKMLSTRSIGNAFCWITSTSPPPEYRHGRLFVEEKVDHQQISLGFNFERVIVKGQEETDSIIQDGNWMWNDFMRAVQTGELTRRLHSMRSNVIDKVPIEFVVDFLLMDHEPGFKKTYRFTGSKFVNEVTNRKVEISHLPTWIEVIPIQDVAILNLWLRFSFEKLDSKQANLWTVGDVVTKLLRPFEDWIG